MPTGVSGQQTEHQDLTHQRKPSLKSSDNYWDTGFKQASAVIQQNCRKKN
jgi:hypothetical protein